MAGTQAGKAMALHCARKALTLGRADQINELARHKVFSADFSSDVDISVVRNTEFYHFFRRLHVPAAKDGAVRLGDALGLRLAGSDLHRRIAIAISRPVPYDPALVEL